MIYSGLVSITFRKLSLKEIAALVLKAGLDGVEWGGDVHVPHGDLMSAQEALKITEGNGLKTASYGSYYRAGISEEEGLAFSPVLDTAVILKAPVIRVWAGNKDWEAADSDYRKKVIGDLTRIGAVARTADIKISLEFHGGTLTNSNESALALAKELADSNVYFHWQPPLGKSEKYCAEGLKKLLPSVTNVHVFHWTFKNEKTEREPLERGRNIWENYLNILSSSGNNHFAMLEFVKDDDPGQFLNDAGKLIEMLSREKTPQV